MDVSVVIVSYNTAHLTEACLKSLIEQTRDVTFEAIVVDNASADDSAERIRAQFPRVRLIALRENIGFARGVNLAAEQASGDFILLLNPDTVVLDGAVQRLFEFARANPRHGIYGGRTLSPEGDVDARSCWGRPTLWSLFCFATGLSTIFARSRLFDPESLGGWQRDSIREVPIVSGCLCLIERSVWRQLGGFDARYFMYGEDADLCLRAIERGWRPVITPSASITHMVGASSATRGDKKILVMRGKATLLRRHFRAWRSTLALFLLSAGVALRARGAQFSASSRPSLDSWSEAWRRRRDWLNGYGGPA